MKILLLGHRGYLGSFLHKNLPVDILDNGNRRLKSNNNNYDYIINCIGRPNLEYCELHRKETNYSNYLIIKDIKKYYAHAKIINFSSYYVYDYDGLCTEDATTTMRYQYCRQKLLAEKENTCGVTFRLGKLFGNRYAKQKKLTEHVLANKCVTLDTVKFNPTSVAQVLRIVKYELQQNKLFGIYNLSNAGITSHYLYGKFITDYLGTKKIIHKVKKINKTFHNYGKFIMSIKKLNEHITTRQWEDDMKDYLDEIE